MENSSDCLVIELGERQPLTPYWLRTKAASFAVRPPNARPPVPRKRNKNESAKIRGASVKAQRSRFGAPSDGHGSAMGGTSDEDGRDRFHAYPDFIAKALSAADEAHAAGESELTVALVEVVCELLYEVGRRP
jgi:hypothetical protein